MGSDQTHPFLLLHSFSNGRFLFLRRSNFVLVGTSGSVDFFLFLLLFEVVFVVFEVILVVVVNVSVGVDLDVVVIDEAALEWNLKK